MSAHRGSVGIVVIGRNEGQRLERCLKSVCGMGLRVVYVDSGSTDGSAAFGRELGAAVVELDTLTPFTAARARNAGFERLLQDQPQTDHVFFVDGDCEVAAGWVDKAGKFLDEHADVGVVCGRRRERSPQTSVYNMLCDIEWDLPAGETPYCGGDALVRVSAFQQAGGYRADLICGEEPELCVRLRGAGWRIWRLQDEMTLHDAAMYRFGQWWRRTLRGGYGFAQVVAIHGAPGGLWVAETRRVWAWAFALPLLTVLLACVAGWSALLLLAAFPLNVIRLARRGRRSRAENWWRAAALVFGNFPELIGQMKFIVSRWRNDPQRIIEYK
jgi:cellulose synthase/poly-beta-1,6-N-acetylglucosamine synthase-like glycosyltransferase